MYKRILQNKVLPVKERIKNLISYYRIRRGARISWVIMFGKFFKAAPENKKPASTQEEEEHARYWQYFSKHINPFTYRVCKNLSGIGKKQYVPEEIYMSDIEPTLNNDSNAFFLANKSFYNHWFLPDAFPKDYFHNINGEYLDKNLNTISFEEVKDIAFKLQYPVSLKPNHNSYGGKGVFFPKDAIELITLAATKKDFVVQEKIKQHPFFNRYNNHGLNTIRVSLYRSVKDNKVHVINASMRMGVGGSLDNLTDGGIVCYIRPDGHLNGYAVNIHGVRHLKHPDTGVAFDEQLPELDKLWELSRKVAQKVFYARIISLDTCYDENANWRVIEVNVAGTHTIKFAQNGGQPYFGEFTEEVIEYCKKYHWALMKN